MSLRVVLDTNVLVSGLLATRGYPRQLIDLWLAGKFSLITSLYQIDELHRVLSYPRIVRRIRLTDYELAIFFSTLSEKGEIVATTPDLSGITRDPKDDAIVACAVAGRAEYVISGDNDLLVLDEYESIRFVSPTEFVTQFAADEL